MTPSERDRAHKVRVDAEAAAAHAAASQSVRFTNNEAREEVIAAALAAARLEGWKAAIAEAAVVGDNAAIAELTKQGMTPLADIGDEVRARILALSERGAEGE
jgi:hypothetical protein